MNEADDDPTIRREAGSSMPIDSQTPTTGLSPEDETIVKRWREEVGDERLRRIAAALTAGRPGRKSEESDRMDLLLMMARFSRAHPNARPYRLARMVVASPEGVAECVRSYATADALNHWLCNKWRKQSVELKRVIAATEQRSSSFNLRDLLETIQSMDRHLKNKPVQDRLQDAASAANKTNAAIMPVLQSFSKSPKVTAIRAALAGPVPPALQSFLASPGFRALRTILGPKDKVDEAVRLLLSPPLEKTPSN